MFLSVTEKETSSPGGEKKKIERALERRYQHRSPSCFGYGKAASMWGQVWFQCCFLWGICTESSYLRRQFSVSSEPGDEEQGCFSLLGMQFSAKVAKGMFQPGISTNEAS